MKASLPENIDLNKHIADYPPEDYGIVKFDQDHAHYLLDLVTTIPARNQKVADSMIDGYTPMYSKALQSVVHDYRQYLDYFITTDVLESDNIYRVGLSSDGKGKSKGYRYAAKHSEVSVRTVGFSEKFCEKLSRDRRKRFNKLRKDYVCLTKWLWPECGLRIDVFEAQRFLSHKRDVQLANPDLQDTKTHPIYGFEIKKKPEVQFMFAMSNVERLASGDIDCTVDQTVGRMHTVLTNMKSDLRNLITYKGAPLVSIDIKNSQPYISTILVKLNNSKRGRDPLFHLKHHLKQQTPPTQPNNPLMLENIKEMSENEDFKIFIKLVKGVPEEGESNEEDLYTYMQKEGAKRGLQFENRSQVKKVMFEVLFSRNRRNTQSKKLFNELFPSVSLVFKSLKEEDHTLLPRLLQTIESFVILHLIAKKIAKRFPNAPIFTIHDSIVTTKEYGDKIEKIMYDELTKIIGISPMLKVDHWSPGNLDWDRYKLPPVSAA